MDLAAFAFANLWSNWLLPVLLLVFGFGLVIFIHELGHFLACKLVDIRVERFAIGFGPKLIGKKLGETEYCINILPLGGYVKMLGQEDFKPLDEDEGAQDPRAFNNKSVGARFLVVSAGVIMNVVLAAVLFVTVCLLGITFIQPIAGGVTPDSPAAKAEIHWSGEAPQATTQTTAPTETQPGTRANTSTGLQAGDRIVALDGKKITRFNKMMVAAILADLDDTFEMKIERSVDGKTYTGLAKIGLMRSPVDPTRKIFGVQRPADNVIAEVGEYRADPQFKTGDEIVAINGTPVEYEWDIDQIQKKIDGDPVTVTILRDGKRISEQVVPTPQIDTDSLILADGTRIRRENIEPTQDPNAFVYTAPDGETRTVTTDDIAPAEQLDVFGMVPRMKIGMISDDSPADKAGLQPGDVIVGYADRGAPTLAELHQLNKKLAGQQTTIVVMRDGKTLDPMQITPKMKDGMGLIGISPVIDLSTPVPATVRERSLAAQAGLQPGDMIQSINDQDVQNWNDIVAIRRSLDEGPVRIAYRRGSHEKTAVIESLDNATYKAAEYGFRVFPPTTPFKQLRTAEIKKNPISAIAWGAAETGDFIVMTYATLKGLITTNVPVKELRGPVGIVDIGIKVGRKSFSEMLYFLAMISVSLAVINFLPIPVVDGGIAVFLLIEKVRGKPLSLKTMNIIQMIGVALLVFVFLAVTWHDIVRILSRGW